MRKLTYILSDFQTVNPEEVFNKDRQALGNILGVPFADEAIVTTSKNEVDYIVTEYGIAHLKGKRASERVKALIAIAHPKFRDELLYEAKKMKFVL